ncbi:hypothetical protein RV11_GL003180 [Enterococcus phoeniculicola]|uniref:Uncharacterized protein n=1 Tax=Enterococcus phoeniculicola ATCC BAA-412 TaxID=1158610 RepID=R3W614_9ENTE|nr:hypothetical protein [Enterococcus phoeniculicola]EOL43002.1 hypothetical protein UC3_01979 [Enterococcus phoeniculicola ATCC BAA-412]EOT76640.1 hypothetical protein I589_01597 [Enterococcus phoeniculicola ATCC BAA-412]OJG72209.1 hypothetical protein RV11_GL003180 [Enterococcus phoeniculicola]
MGEVKIRKINDGTIAILDTQAKEKGYASRQEYLQDLLEKIAREEYQFETDVRYQFLISQYNELIEWLLSEVTLNTDKKEV